MERNGIKLIFQKCSFKDHNWLSEIFDESCVIIGVHFSCNLTCNELSISYIHDWNFRLHKIYSNFGWILLIFEKKIFSIFEKFQILEYGLETEWPSDAKVLERDWANVLEHLWSIIKDTVTKLTKLKDGLKDTRPGNFITAK